ncbi:hypothetical protein KJ758_01320 [Patescibacteria group bacterium]|nr:hypothetical protein [Patescibacteria group bacterium]
MSELLERPRAKKRDTEDTRVAAFHEFDQVEEREIGKHLAVAELPPPDKSSEEEARVEADPEMVQSLSRQWEGILLSRKNMADFGQAVNVAYETKFPEKLAAVEQVLASKEIQDAVRSCFLYRINELKREPSNIEGGVFYWMVQFAKSEYPHLDKLLSDQEVKEGLEWIYRKKIEKEARSGQILKEGERGVIDTYKSAFNISVPDGFEEKQIEEAKIKKENIKKSPGSKGTGKSGSSGGLLGFFRSIFK